MYNSKPKTKFILLEENQKSENGDNLLNEFHYKGGIAIQNDMLSYDQHNGKLYGGGEVSSEKHEYKEFENKIIPLSLAYTPNIDNLRGGDELIPDQVISEDMYNKLFFSVANEVNEKGNKKTMKKLK
uniref:Uncharacterized protein n=1 Tax=viral metagenome TaxID=1070528 RepID=A0A6C0HZ92_9ZZZZ